MPLPETLSSVATVADAIRRCASSIASYAYQRHCRRAYSRCPIAAEILAAPDVERHIAENADELATEVMGMDAGKTSDPMTLALIDTANDAQGVEWTAADEAGRRAWLAWTAQLDTGGVQF